MRLAAMGLAGEFVADYVAQQFTAAQLTAEDVCFVVSASGQNEATLRVAEIARNAGATVIALCSFPRSPLAAIAHSTLIAVPVSYTHLDVYKRQVKVQVWVGSTAALAGVGSPETKLPAITALASTAPIPNFRVFRIRVMRAV